MITTARAASVSNAASAGPDDSEATRRNVNETPSVSTYSRDNGVWSISLIASGRSVTDKEIDIPISHIRISGNTSANVTVNLSRENCLSSLPVCARIFFMINSFLLTVSFAHFFNDRDEHVFE